MTGMEAGGLVYKPVVRYFVVCKEFVPVLLYIDVKKKNTSLYSQ